MSADAELDAHNDRMRQLEGQLADLRATRVSLSKEQENMSMQQHSEATELVQLREALSEMTLQVHEMPARVTAAREEEDRRSAAISCKLAEVSSEQQRQVS